MRSRRGPHAPIGHNAPKVKWIPSLILFCQFEQLNKQQCSCVWVFPSWNILQGLKEDIDSRLSRVQEIRFEPRLLSEEDDRLKQGSQISQSLLSAHLVATWISLKCILFFLRNAPKPCLYFKGCYNYLYRMKALDAIRDSGESSNLVLGHIVYAVVCIILFSVSSHNWSCYFDIH